LSEPLEEAVGKMKAFIQKYGEAHEKLNKELRGQLKTLIHECAKLLENEEIVNEVYRR